ncbi:MAG TPA: M28 family peptidase [Flavobacteriales bacterium]|nr:M28 family peptidase [Flavobacteriales bacterium]
MGVNRLVFTLIIMFCSFSLFSQTKEDSVFLKKIFNESLSRGRAYTDLRYLCKKIGCRVSGSKQAQKAVDWTNQLMREYGFDTVYLQQIEVPNWKRGKKEKIYVRQTNPNKEVMDPFVNSSPKMTALGGSVGTNGKMQGEVVMVKSFDELKALGADKVKGKIVFFNMVMDPTNIQTFKSYGGCVTQRVSGADEASALGAKAVIIRSVTLAHDDHPHTGSVKYDGVVPKIPAVAISTQAADNISEKYERGYKTTVDLELECKWMPDTISYNVVGEIRGKTHPERIIAVGGHLDSWDIGEGAHDDGAGCIHSIESVRLLKVLGYQPNYTLRVVMFMNEENGLRGGKNYASIAKAKKEIHAAGIESDAGGLVPRGFSFEKAEFRDKALAWKELFKPYNIHYFELGGSGADIGQLSGETDGALIGFVPDNQRYFDYHHSPSDVFENVNRRELELGAATISSLIYLIDKYQW